MSEQQTVITRFQDDAALESVEKTQQVDEETRTPAPHTSPLPPTDVSHDSEEVNEREPLSTDSSDEEQDTLDFDDLDEIEFLIDEIEDQIAPLAL
jgi:hypothetical protein